MQTQFTTHNNNNIKNLTTTKNINKLFENNFLLNKLTKTSLVTLSYNHLKHTSNITTNIFNTTKTITNTIINNHFNT